MKHEKIQAAKPIPKISDRIIKQSRSHPSAYLIYSFDSIFVFDKWLGTLTLVDEQSQVSSKYELVREGRNSGFAFSTIEKSSPIIKK